VNALKLATSPCQRPTLVVVAVVAGCTGGAAKSGQSGNHFLVCASRFLKFAIQNGRSEIGCAQLNPLSRAHHCTHVGGLMRAPTQLFSPAVPQRIQHPLQRVSKCCSLLKSTESPAIAEACSALTGALHTAGCSGVVRQLTGLGLAGGFSKYTETCHQPTPATYSCSGCRLRGGRG